MASEWFYRAMGKQVGPVSSVELRNLAQAGTVTIETPVANASNGHWVPAGRVKGLFALPNGVSLPAAATGTTQIPPARAATSEESSGLGAATKITLVVSGGVCILVLGFLVWFIANRDTWELNNASRLSAKLDEADRLQQSDFVAAYKTYDEALKEAKQHRITDAQFAQKLADAENSRRSLYTRVQEKTRADEVEKKRQAEEEARRAAAEEQRVAEEEARRAAVDKQRVADEENRKHAAEEARQITEQKRRKEEQQRQEAIAAYRNAPESARNALNAVKKVEARTEVGINYEDYSTVVGEAWADVKIFTESPEGKKLPAFSHLLVSAMGECRLALNIWHGRIDSPPVYDAELSDELLKKCWAAAHRRIDMAESLITQGDVATILLKVAELQKIDANYISAVQRLLDPLSLIQRSVVEVSFLREIMLTRSRAEAWSDVPESDRAEYESNLKAISDARKIVSQKIDEIDRRDKQDMQGS